MEKFLIEASQLAEDFQFTKFDAQKMEFYQDDSFFYVTIQKILALLDKHKARHNSHIVCTDGRMRFILDILYFG